MEPCAVRWTLFVDSFASFACAAAQPACWPTSAETTPRVSRPGSSTLSPDRRPSAARRTRRCWLSAREVPRRTLVAGHERREAKSRSPYQARAVRSRHERVTEAAPRRVAIPCRTSDSPGDRTDTAWLSRSRRPPRLPVGTARRTRARRCRRWSARQPHTAPRPAQPGAGHARRRTTRGHLGDLALHRSILVLRGRTHTLVSRTRASAAPTPSSAFALRVR